MKMITMQNIGHLWAYVSYVLLYMYLFNDEMDDFRKLLSQNHSDQIVISILAGGKKGPRENSILTIIVNVVPFDCKQ